MAIDFQVTFDASDPARLAEFWATALGYQVEPPPAGFDSWPEFLASIGWTAGDVNAASAIIDPEGLRLRIYFQKVPETKTVKNRVHLDLRSAPGLRGDERMAALEARCAELVLIGASRLRRHEPDAVAPGWIVMTDPEGNEFCLD